MIHEIAPEYLDNQYHPGTPLSDGAKMMLFRDRELLALRKEGRISYPIYRDVKDLISQPTYLFSVSGTPYFMASLIGELNMPGEWVPFMELRDSQPVHEALAGMTAIHLHNWYRSVTYCGCCGTKAVHDEKERMMHCPSCGNMMFPKISPAVIVAVKNKDRLLLTKYRRGEGLYHALVAGFVEIGETAEECVAREVMEETGVRIKNIRYFGTQPWGFAGNLMMGYTAELDGSEEIRLDRDELAVAEWLLPEEIEEIPDHSSLTREMIRRFKHGELKFS